MDPLKIIVKTKNSETLEVVKQLKIVKYVCEPVGGGVVGTHLSILFVGLDSLYQFDKDNYHRSI